MSNSSEKKLWVVINSLKENTSDTDLQKIASDMGNVVDKWQSKGKFVWSGPLDNKKSGMAIIEALESEANAFLAENKKAGSKVLDSYLYQWDAMPILSLL